MTWRSAITTNFLTALTAALGPSLGILNLTGTTRPFLIARGAAIVSAVVLLVFLVAQRRHSRLPVVRAAFVLPAIPLLLMHWYVDQERAAQGLPVELFSRQLVVSMTFAVLTPPRAAMSLAVIGTFSMENLVLYWTARESHLWRVNGWQPWSNLLAAACLALLALYRAHRERREIAMLVEVEQAAAFQRLMRMYLAVRDLVNTPLQTLRVSASVLATRHPEERDVTATMERAVQRLEELNRVLTPAASTVEWPLGGESFDPLALLRTPNSRPGS